jgi:hypothetical protein
MAPEQTGRMNRSIDAARSLLAEGVTLYEMDRHASLHRRRPHGVGPLSHRPPADAAEAGRRHPAPVAGIIMKLLAKTGEDRYQTAAGLGPICGGA